MALGTLAITYFNWRGRFIPASPRKVHLAHEFLAGTQYAEHRSVTARIIRKMELGEDLTPHLSRGVEEVYTPHSERTSRSGGRRDLDRLMADWAIHHLHLSLHMETHGFVTRSDDLLFGHFAGQDAYLIGIFPHGSWTLIDIAQIAVRNWPQAGIFHELKGSIRLEQPISDDERPLLRNAGLSSLLEIDGRVYAPAGQSTAGTPIAAARESNKLMHALRTARELLHTEGKEVVRLAGGNLGTRTPAWAAVQEGDLFAIRETNTGVLVWQVQFHD